MQHNNNNNKNLIGLKLPEIIQWDKASWIIISYEFKKKII